MTNPSTSPLNRLPRPRRFAQRPIFETIESRVMLSGILFTSVQNGNWSDGATWDKGTAPGPADLVFIDHGDAVVYDQTDPDTIARLEIHGSLTFNPNATLDLNTTGNIVLHGELDMHPASDAYKHTITFKGVDESKFVGGGMEVLETDVGMWIHESGKLDAVGTAKNPWTRLTGGVSAAATTITVQDASGWKVNDKIAITPTQPPNVSGGVSYGGYDERTIASISGNTITLSSALTYAHPIVNGTWTAEVLNLSRNVVITGEAPTTDPVTKVTSNHRAHIMFMHLDANNAQTIKNIELAYLGPNKDGVGILGRYALHFHMNGDSTAGSLIENVVAHDIGAHVFVPHLSNGITFKGTVSHNTYDAAYWWDSGEANATNDTVWDSTVASLVKPYSTQLSYRLPGYFLGHGTNNTVSNSVAVGVRGNEDASGFTWPEAGSGIWNFHDNMAHNNQRDGIFTWQNTSNLHVIENFTAYYNSDNGIEHGAYANSYTYRDITLYGNLTSGFFLHSSSGGVNPQTLENLNIDGAGISPYALQIVHHTLPAGLPTLVKGGEFKNYTTAAVGWTQGSDNKEWFTFDGVKFGNDATAFLLHNSIQPDSLITVRSTANDYYQLRRADQTGTAYPAWNASKTTLDQWISPDEAARTSISHTFTAANGSAWDPAFWNVTNVGHTISIQSNTGEIRMATGGYGLATVAPQAGIVDLMVDSSQLVTALASTNTVGMQGGLIARRTDEAPDTYYKAVMNTELSGRTLSIIRVTNGGEVVLARVSNWNPTVNYNIRFEVTQETWSSTRLKAKIWDAATAEPSSWNISRTDTHPDLQNVKGQIGLFGKGGSSTARYWRFDNYSASVPLPELSESWTGPDAAGWPAQWTIAPIGTTGMTPSILSNKGKITKSISQANGDGLAFINTQVTRDVDITSSFNISSNAAGFGLMARGIDTNADGSLDTHYYTQVISSTASNSYTFRLYKSVAGVSTLLANTSLYYASSGVEFKMRLQAFSNPDNTTTLKARMWASASAEPTTWDINITNNEPALQNVDGRFGMRFKMFQNRIITVDDFTATFAQESFMMMMMAPGGGGSSSGSADSRLAIKQGDSTLSSLFAPKSTAASDPANPLKFILKLLDETQQEETLPPITG
jgi:hypothetical protein